MQGKSLKKYLVVFLGLFLLGGIADAQRLVPGQNVISVTGSFYDQMGGRLNWALCDRFGRPIFGLGVMNTVMEKEQFKIDKDESTKGQEMTYYLKSIDIMASGGYLWRLYGTRNRIFNIYGGATFDLGARVHKRGLDSDNNELPRKEPMAKELPRTKFIFGFTPRLELEVFPFKSVSLMAYAYPRIQLYGHRHYEKIFYPEFGIGVNVYFF